MDKTAEFLNEMNKNIEHHKDERNWTRGEWLLYLDMLYLDEKVNKVEKSRVCRHWNDFNYFSEKRENKGRKTYVRDYKESKRNRIGR